MWGPKKNNFWTAWSISPSDLIFLGVARILKSFISMSFEMWESYLWLRNIELVVAYIKVPVPGVPYRDLSPTTGTGSVYNALLFASVSSDHCIP
jgi:hypothetical protein